MHSMNIRDYHSSRTGPLSRIRTLLCLYIYIYIYIYTCTHKYAHIHTFHEPQRLSEPSDWLPRPPQNSFLYEHRKHCRKCRYVSQSVSLLHHDSESESESGLSLSLRSKFCLRSAFELRFIRLFCVCASMQDYTCARGAAYVYMKQFNAACV